MKPDDFEASLSRIPLRSPPSAWRDEILAAARKASPPAIRNTPDPAAGFAAWLRRISIPWATLAGAAAACLILNGMGYWLSPLPTPGIRSPRPASPTGFATAIRAHQSQVLALYETEETEPNTPNANKPSPGSPAIKPRSDLPREATRALGTASPQNA